MRRPENSEGAEAPLRLGGRIPMTSLIQSLAVAEYLNFRHAANALGVSQSSVSARIKALEENLGILLFERHSRGVRLTEAGRHFIESVAGGIDQIEHSVKTAGAVARGDLGCVRVGVYALTPGSFLDRLISQYRKDHPRVALNITEGTARDTIMQIRDHQLDVAFVAGAPELPDCHSRRIWDEPLLAALPARHRFASRASVTWDDLAKEVFLVRHGGTGPQAYDHIVLRLARHWAAPSILRFDVERCTLLQMIAQDYGISIASDATALVDVPGVIFRPLYDEPDPVPFSAVWSPYNRSAALRNLLDIAKRIGKQF